MIEHDSANAEFRDIEEMVRAAGGYLEVSDDLRPDTLEEARNETRETSSRSWIGIVAVAVVFLAVSAGMLRGHLSSAPSLMMDVGADGDQLAAVASRKAARTRADASWSLVDAFLELRQRQASLIDDGF